MRLLRTNSILLLGCLAISAVASSCSSWSGPITHLSSSHGSFDEDDVVWDAELVHHLEWVEGDTELSVRLGVGDLEIVPGTEGALKVEVNVRASADASIDERTSDFGTHIKYTWNDQGLALEDAHLSDDGWCVDVKLYVPPSLELDLAAGVGKVQIDAPVAGIKASVGVGHLDIETHEITGSLKLTSGVGDIDVNVPHCLAPDCVMTTGVGDIRASFDALGSGYVLGESGTGSLYLTLPRGCAAEYDCRSGTGSVKGAGALGLTVKDSFVGGHASGVVGEGGPSIRLTSGVGDIVVSTHKSH